jgi:probable phosphoglycerate mutase
MPVTLWVALRDARHPLARAAPRTVVGRAPLVTRVTLWLVRHGATDWSDAGRLTGWTDVPLNDRGRLQAGLLRERLARETFAGVWSSDLVRASETARLATGAPVLEPSLRELDFGRLEGKRWDELPAELQDALLAFEGFRAPGGESVADLRDRVQGFLRRLRPGTHLVFTHGGVIRLLLRDAAPDLRIAPGELVRLRLQDRGGVLVVAVEEDRP